MCEKGCFVETFAFCEIEYILKLFDHRCISQDSES